MHYRNVDLIADPIIQGILSPVGQEHVARVFVVQYEISTWDKGSAGLQGLRSEVM